MIYPEKENASLELKESLSDSFLKTVSAYANYRDGRIVFGVSDDGTITGISDERKLRLQIENKINDCITPRPQFKMDRQEIDGKVLIVLSVLKGKMHPISTIKPRTRGRILLLLPSIAPRFVISSLQA